jgi:hypothetical protein
MSGAAVLSLDESFCVGWHPLVASPAPPVTYVTQMAQYQPSPVPHRQRQSDGGPVGGRSLTCPALYRAGPNIPICVPASTDVSVQYRCDRPLPWLSTPAA